MKIKKIVTMLLISIMLLLSFAGCSKDDSNSADSNNSDKTEVRGNESESIDKNQYINDFIESEPSTLDSAQTGDSYSIEVLTNIMEPLIRFEDDDTGNVFEAPAAAESYSISDDELVWTFKLRDNKWSDGVQVTAHDYEYGIKRALDPNVGGLYTYLLTPIKNANAINNGEMGIEELGVKAVDEKTLEITLESPTPYFIKLTVLPAMLPQRRDVVEAHGDSYGSDAETLVSNGPFEIKSWVHNNEIVLEKNEEYWDKDVVMLQTISYKILQDPNSIYNSFEAGSLDAVSASTTEWIERFSSAENINSYQYPRGGVNYQYYNQNVPLLSNAKVRKALSMVIDREELSNALSDGVNEAAYGFIPTGITVGDINYREAVVEPFKKIYDENIDPKELLIEGLEELGMDTDPSEITLTFSLGGTDQLSKMYGEYMQQVYKNKLGIKLELELLDWGVFYSNFYNYDYEIGYMNWTAEFNDPLYFMTSLDSELDGLVIGWANKRVDELLELAMAEEDDEKRLEYIAEMENLLLYEDCSVAPVSYSNRNLFRYKYVKNASISTSSTVGYKYVYTSGRE